MDKLLIFLFWRPFTMPLEVYKENSRGTAVVENFPIMLRNNSN
jgi:hypothetical protein